MCDAADHSYAVVNVNGVFVIVCLKCANVKELKVPK